MKEYNKKWQILRGICIICVIQIHCLAGIGDEFNAVDRVYYLFVRNLINFPVPLFFFISGYFAVNTDGKIEPGEKVRGGVLQTQDCAAFGAISDLVYGIHDSVCYPKF